MYPWQKLHLHEDVENKNHALKFSSEMLTDEIMDEVEMKTGVPKKQQRIPYQSTQRTTRQALKYYNTQENDTIDLSLELKGGTGTTDPTEHPTLDTEEIATQRRSDHQVKDNHTTCLRSRSRRTRISRRGHHSRATQTRYGKIGKAKSRSGHP